MREYQYLHMRRSKDMLAIGDEEEDDDATAQGEIEKTSKKSKGGDRSAKVGDKASVAGSVPKLN